MPPDPHLERLKLAFALHVARKLVNADDVVTPEEVELVHRMLPQKMLEAAGFVDPGTNALTPAFKAARAEAVAELPRRLTVPEKEEFLAWFRQVANADGHVDPREEKLIAQAAKALGLDA